MLCLTAFPAGGGGSAPDRELYVSPSGTPAGPGTLAQPYDIATAFSGRVAQPGDTFWLRGGNYALGHLDTTVAGAPGRPVTFRQVPGEKARVDGSLTFFGSPGHVILRDFELYSSDTNRLSAQTGAGVNPPPGDINPIIGIACHAPNFSFINLVVHDQTRSGIYLSEIATNTLVYGCVLYNNGWASPDNAEGHNVYVQSHIGTREIADNVAFNAAGANFHLYESRSNGWVANVTLEGNVAFHAGALQTVRPYQDWIVGADPPALGADRIILRSNMTYFAPGSGTLAEVQLGRAGINGSVALLDNYFTQGVSLNNWTLAAVAGNVFAGRTAGPLVRLNQSAVALAAAWDGNVYTRTVGGPDFQFNATVCDFAGWRQLTGFDAHSTHTIGNLTGTSVFVRPNRYEPGRAHVIVYNWDNLASVPVDVAAVLPVGATYEVFNLQNLDAPPVLRGVFDGAPLLLPMTGLTVAAPNGPLLTPPPTKSDTPTETNRAPNGPLLTPPPTGPTFNVFLLLPCYPRLAITRVAGAVELSWPTNCGAYVLQSRAGLADANGWTDLGIEPVVRADRYVVTSPLTAPTRFYRLRSP